MAQPNLAATADSSQSGMTKMEPNEVKSDRTLKTTLLTPVCEHVEANCPTHCLQILNPNPNSHACCSIYFLCFCVFLVLEKLNCMLTLHLKKKTIIFFFVKFAAILPVASSFHLILMLNYIYYMLNINGD